MALENSLFAAPPFRLEARLHTLVDRQRRQYVQPNGWPSSSQPYDRSNGIDYRASTVDYRSNGGNDQRARAAHEQQYQERLRQQMEEARRRAACNPRPPPPAPPVPQTRRNCPPRRPPPQELRLPPTPPPQLIRRNCRPRTTTYPPPPVHAPQVICRPAAPAPPPPPQPQPQRRTNCVRPPPTHPPRPQPPQQQYFNCQPTPPPQQRVPCYPAPPAPQAVRYDCQPQRLPRGEDNRSNEFRASPGCVAPASATGPNDCVGSVKIVSVNAAGVVEHYMYKTGKDVGEVVGESLSVSNIDH